jgi:hypothetical protein
VEFLGLCEVCGKLCRNYLGLAGHLRHNQDPRHLELKARWKAWRVSYRRGLHCRKCGGTWVVTDRKLKDKKRCPSCEEARARLGKRGYERTETSRQPKRKKNRGWVLVEGDEVHTEVVSRFREGQHLRQIMRELALPYKAVRSVLEESLGAECYAEVCRGRQLENTRKAYTSAHSSWEGLSPEAKADLVAIRFGKTRKLELGFSSQLLNAGVLNFDMNCWQALPVDGRWVPREADLKICLPEGRKLVILCDGEAFHGPQAVFTPVEVRVLDDVKTAEAYFEQGYSVIRYSESEIHSGWALNHLLMTMSRLEKVRQVYRMWHPLVEREL